MKFDGREPIVELKALKPKAKQPGSIRVLNSWIDRAENDLRGERTGRLAWLVATTIVAAKMQQVLDESGNPRFILKGGTMLQHRLGMQARASRDLDGIVREDLGVFLEQLDMYLGDPWGTVTFRRTEAEEIRVPSKSVNPRRFEMILEIKGVVWRRIKVEISPDEGNAGSFAERYRPPVLDGFGLPTPDFLVGMAMSYQIAQKLRSLVQPRQTLCNPIHTFPQVEA